MQFDIIIQNPPYNSNKVTSKLWPSFIEFGMNNLKQNGEMLVICPLVWTEKSGLKIKRATNLLYTKQINWLDLDTSKYFEGIGEKICHFSVSNEIRTKETKITQNGIEVSEMIDGPLERNKGIKYNITQKLITRHDKTWNLKSRGIEDIDHNTNTITKVQTGLLSLTQDEEYNIPIYDTVNKIYYINEQHITKGWRCLINISGYYYQDGKENKYMPVLKDIGNVNGTRGILCKSEQEAKNARTLFKSKLYRYVNDNNKSGGFNTIAMKFPVLDTSKSWTDEMVYEYFNITKEEQQEIEQWK